MSANIPIGKLKFTVFGKGYDDDRGNSGAGTKESAVLNYRALSAEIDATGRYIWVVGDYVPNGMQKIDTYTWTAVSTGDIPHYKNINHPKNVANNIGIVQNNESDSHTIYLFDLTTNEMINSGEMSYYAYVSHEDCILVDDTIYLATLTQGRAGNIVRTLNIDDLSMTTTGTIGRSFVGFTDNTHIFGYYPKEWFYQDSNISLLTTSGGWVWDVQQSSFPNIATGGLTRNGKIYLPSLINNKWVLGEYPQTPSPDVNTPSPSRYFGDFGGYPNTLNYTEGLTIRYNTTRDIALICTTDVGAFITDFQDLYKISDLGGMRALAVNDEMAVVSHDNVTEVIMF